MIKEKRPLRAYRMAQGISTDEIAKQLGVAASTLRSWENGNRQLSAEMAVKVEKLFGIARASLRPDVFA